MKGFRGFKHPESKKLTIGLSTGSAWDKTKNDWTEYGEKEYSPSYRGTFTGGSLKGEFGLAEKKSRRSKTSIGLTGGADFKKFSKTRSGSFDRDTRLMDDHRFNAWAPHSGTKISDSYKENMRSLKGGKFKGDELNVNVGVKGKHTKTSRSGNKHYSIGGEGGVNLSHEGKHIGKTGSANIYDKQHITQHGTHGVVIGTEHTDMGMSNWAKKGSSTKIKPYASASASAKINTGQYSDSGKLGANIGYGTKHAPKPGVSIGVDYQKGRFKGGLGYNYGKGNFSAGVSYTIGGKKKKK